MTRELHVALTDCAATAKPAQQTQGRYRAPRGGAGMLFLK